MFWFTVLMVIITYPVVLAGSCVCLCIIAILSSGGGDDPNPFVSPAKVYRVYRTTFTSWLVSIKEWYIRES